MKKIGVLILSVFMIAGLYAQTAKSVGLTDKDVRNWTKNCVAIQEELTKNGIGRDVSPDMDNKSEAEKILQKYGISKPNSVEKYSVILQSAVILKAESMLDEQTRAMMQVIKIDPFADLRTHINEKDYNVVAANSQAVFKAMKDVDDYTASTLSAASSDDKFDEDYLISAYQEVFPDAYDDSDEKLKEDVKKKYNTKKKFKVVKDKDKTEYIIIQPSDITFSNSSEAEAYAELYTGVAGEWVMVSSCGYLGTHNGNKAFYTWGSGGVLVYSKFPIDMDTCAPDKFIPDEEVTPAIAKKTVLQMYKCGD